MTMTLTGGAAVVMFLVTILFTALWVHFIYICIVGGEFEMSYKSKGAIPQIKQFIKRRWEKK